MQYVIGCLVLVSSLAFNSHADEAPVSKPASCECPKLGCDPCAMEKGITFFTEKCGPENSKMKSCARPTCIPIDQASRECPNPPLADSGPRPPIVVAASSDVKREPASGDNAAHPAGRVRVIQGSVQIVQADGKTRVIAKNADGVVNEGDRIESGKDSSSVVSFQGGNKLHVHPDTTIEIKEFRDQENAESRKALLNLVKGKVRNQVNQKYTGKTSYYRITTRGAVAGVRGTDFIVTHTEDTKMETHVETLGGKVILSNLDETDRRELLRGDAVSFIAAIPAADAAAGAAPPGKFSDVQKLTPEELNALDLASRADIARELIAKSKGPRPDEPICEKPKGFFNQCMWKCEGNPKDEKKSCRTDLAQVRCARARCNANGQWAEDTRLPASAGEATCPATGMLIKDCDY